MKVFISHSHKDEALAKKVATILQEDGLDVWDENEILPGENWAEKIAQALNESKAMIVLLTPEALQSRWVQYEIEYALTKKSYSHRLFPVVIGTPQEIPNDSIPWILRRFKLMNFSEQSKIEEGIKEIAQTLKQSE